jgi:hypothetical protein
MIRRVCGFRAAALGLLAVSLTAAVPTTGRAAWLGYRNDTKTPVIVQVASVQRNVVRRGAPHQLSKGDVAWDCILQPGLQIITVYDAGDPKRVLYSERRVLGAGMDLFFSIQAEMPPPPRKGAQPPPPKFSMKVVPAPSPPPGMRR